MAESRGNLSKLQSLLSSSAGFIAAIAIIVVFIFAATFFKPVVFGILLAYLFLPLENFYRNYLLKLRLFTYLSSFFGFIFKPASAIKERFQSRSKSLKPVNKEEKHLKREIRKSCILTILTVFILMGLALSGIFWISTTYINNASSSISSWAKKTNIQYEKPNLAQNDAALGSDSSDSIREEDEDKGPLKEFFEALHYKIEALKPKLEKFKLFVLVKDYLGTSLASPDDIRNFLKSLTHRSGDLFAYTAGLLGTLAFIMIKLVFTFFFFAFFLNKLVAFNCNKGHRVSTGEYLADSMMMSKWFPKTKEGTKENTAIILDNIIFKLKIWLRGYFIIIVIESTFYSTVFSLIGVPFGLILGLIAGFTILLPYIGPIASALLTLTVCLVTGQVTMTQMILVILSYVFMTGILDQLFIYPAVVGASLGLNELETIVVVILGGMFFGITGMIFAVPTTSILKYLIPEIYNLLEKNKLRTNT